MAAFKTYDPSLCKDIIIHCSATPPSAGIGAAEIDRWHRERGWLMIGYHFVIRRDGTVELGRYIDPDTFEFQAGAHCEGHNESSIGICLVGGVDAKGVASPNFTEKQMDRLQELLDELLWHYPNAEFLGHRDMPGVKKACPSFDVRFWEHTGVLRP